ncbi:MAG: ABC transporter ATP-binding protein [Actinomycetota bacterium]|nr:ABC transporter ATP-binding protein [Actinomycetota bacterium]
MNATKPARLSARGLVKSYGEGRSARTILDGIDLDVRAGELVALTGRSGSGKSSLMNLLGGLDWPDGGTVAVDGRPLLARDERSSAAVRRSCIGFVFQAFHLVPELSGRANVLLPARIGGGSNGAAAADRRADLLIEALGVTGVAGHRPHELSGGEQQRFAIARALINEPVLILADEPTGNLDEHSARLVLDLLCGLTGDRAVVLATHDESAIRAADRHLRLADGRLHPR